MQLFLAVFDQFRHFGKIFVKKGEIGCAFGARRASVQWFSFQYSERRPSLMWGN